MGKQEASRSAAVVAAHRAMEWLRPEGERICHDPYAGMLIPEGTTVIGQSELPQERALDLFRQFVPGFHEYFLARTRAIDDALTAAIARGVAQVVILGAGYDSRAHRFEGLMGNRPVFEVDHPATQAVKRKRLSLLPGLDPNHAVYVPADLGEDSLGVLLPEYGYQPGLSTFFIWEGVSMYLPQTAVETILGVAAECSGPGSEIIFDVTSPEVIRGTAEEPEAAAWYKKTAESGEPLTFGIGKEELILLLNRTGFARTAFFDSAFFNRSYFSRPGDNREATSILTLVLAGKE